VSRRQKPKYRLPRAGRSSSPGLLFWLGVLAVLVLVIWYLWPAQPAKKAVLSRPSFVQLPLPTAVAPALARTSPPVAPLLQAQVPPGPPPAVAVPKVASPPTNPVPPAVITPASTSFPRPVRNPFEAQVALARLGISPGSIDGANGTQTRLALRQFQRANHLPTTGVLDSATRALLTLDEPVLTDYTVTTADLGRLQPIGKTWLEKSQQSALDYETETELVGELSHANPALIRQLNPGVDWKSLKAGTVLQVPDVQYPDVDGKAALVIIHLSEKYLEAFDESSNLLLHCPCSIAAHVEKRPVGLLHVVVVISHPNYTFDPAIFPESPEAQRIGHKLVLPPGPNNPVGVAWMGLDRPGYGMHGTPAPEQVGRTESHGCFRLANWDAEYLLKLVWIGMPVYVKP
jgi:lipoprotein-anchoring transpeptidase ErfK/SrfK